MLKLENTTLQFTKQLKVVSEIYLLDDTDVTAKRKLKLENFFF